jgi:putative tryptophan/tyrosine transport system substrate-binding protein
MKRREFIAFVVGTAGGVAVARPFALCAQQATPPVIGFLSARSSDSLPHLLDAFRKGLKEAGYSEGENLKIELRWAEGHYDRLPALAAELVQRRVAVIAAFGTDAGLAAKVATARIPIVFIGGVDPVKLRLVGSFIQPSGNVTGVSILSNNLVSKRMAVLHQLRPKATLIGLLVNPSFTAAKAEAARVQAAAATFGVSPVVVRAVTERDLEPAFATLIQQRAEALDVEPDPFFIGQAANLAALAIRHALPAIYGLREYVAAGGLISYGASIADGYRQVGIYTGRILKGEKPADLPLQQSVKVELVINLKTAKALGLTVPASLLARADELIE